MDYLPRMEVAVKDFRVKYVVIITLFGRKMCFTAQKPPILVTSFKKEGPNDTYGIFHDPAG
jgi:hypothetical protein